MTGTVQAPFTRDEVHWLKRWQMTGWVHPLTCPNRDTDHRMTTDVGVLGVNDDGSGLLCPDCGYVQTWVPRACVLPTPPNPFPKQEDR